MRYQAAPQPHMPLFTEPQDLPYYIFLHYNFPHCNFGDAGLAHFALAAALLYYISRGPGRPGSPNHSGAGPGIAAAASPRLREVSAPAATASATLQDPCQVRPRHSHQR